MDQSQAERAAAVEIVTADGEILTASRSQHPDVFHALPESLGTIASKALWRRPAAFG